MEKEVKYPCGKISSFLFLFKIILVFIYNLVCIAVALFPTILKSINLYLLLVLILPFSFTLDFFFKNKLLKTFNYILKFLFLLIIIPVYFLISRFIYFINKDFVLLLFIILGVIYFYRFFFLKKIYLPLIFPATCIFVSAIVFQSFYVNRDESKYKIILAQKYIKPLLVFNKSYGKKCLYLVNAGSPKRMLTDEKEKYLFVTFQDKPRNSYLAVRFNFKTLSNLKVLFGTSSKDPVIYKNKIFILVHDKRQVLVVDTNTFQIIKKIPVKYNLLMQILIDEKNNKLYITSEQQFLQIFSLNNLHFEKDYSLPIIPYLVIIDNIKQKMYVGILLTKTISKAMSNYSIVEINLQKLKITKYLGKPWWVILGLDINKEQNLLYAVETLSGYLKVVDINNFKIIKELYLGVGLREIVFDKKRNLIYVGNFITGDLYILHSKNYKLIKKIYVGDKIRGIYITPKTNKVLVANVYGVFEIKADELLKNYL